MTTTRRSGRTLVVATLSLGVGLFACSGGPGTYGSSVGSSFSENPGFGDGYPLDANAGYQPDQGSRFPGASTPGGGDEPRPGAGGNTAAGGTNGGPGKSCEEVGAAFTKCDSKTFGSAEFQDQLKSACAPFTAACRACVAALSCADLNTIAATGEISGTSCAATCSSATGSGGTGGGSTGKGGTGGTGGTGGGSTGKGGSATGDCLQQADAKIEECGLDTTAADVCGKPACASCVQALPCANQDSCSSACSGP